MITGQTLLDWGFTPGKWFGGAIAAANTAEEAGASEIELFHLVASMEPEPVRTVPLRTNSLPFEVFLEPENEEERINHVAVVEAMDRLMRVPTIRSGVVMPDACPAGVIPVGGVVAAENAIHPGFHSADICCSMAISVFKRDMDLKVLLDAAEKITHFGPGKRAVSQTRQNSELKEVLADFENNRFLSGLESTAEQHFMTQGDGNHFLFVGRLKSTGAPAIVTHHGSRGLGAKLYKRGLEVAKRHTAIHSPSTPPEASWIDSETDDGRSYWDGLQIVRDWTKLNHFALHDAIAKKIGNRVEDRFWNEHNFVFRKSDGLFYHAKGATPSYSDFADDDSGLTLIPMNMSEPILITRHVTNDAALGFAPHGAGRNMSRTQYVRGLSVAPADQLAALRESIDVRFYLGTPDASELPGAYKSAAQVRSMIEKHGLATIEDEVIPFGTIMAGEMHWKNKKSR